MRFFKRHVTFGCWIHGSRWSTFLHFGGLKSDSCRVVKSSTPVQLSSYQPLLDILATWKCEFSRVMRPSDQRYVAFIRIQFSILAAWKCDSLSVLRPSANVANCERIIELSWPKNPIHCTSWNPYLKVHAFCESFFSNSVDWRRIPQRAWDPLPVAI
jgi:hypothetical protein